MTFSMAIKIPAPARCAHLERFECLPLAVPGTSTEATAVCQVGGQKRYLSQNVTSTSNIFLGLAPL